MCSKCSKALGSHAIKVPHASINCPLNCFFCSICCSYGHTTDDCPDHELSKHRDIEYVEQLLPPSIRKSYSITSLTPLSKKTAAPGPTLPTLEVEESEKSIRAILLANDIQPSNKPKENRRLMKQLADELGRKLYYIPAK
jgi:hypothetical protein